MWTMHYPYFILLQILTTLTYINADNDTSPRSDYAATMMQGDVTSQEDELDDVNMTYPPPKHLKIGVVSPMYGSAGYVNTAVAATLAVQDAQRDGYLPGINITFHWRDSGCSGKRSLGVAVDLKYKENVDGFLGMPCTDSALNAGKLIAYWNLPLISYSSPDPLLANKTTYSTLLRFVSPFNKLANALVVFFKYVKWKRAVMLTGQDPEFNCDYASRALEERFRKNNLLLADWLRIDQDDKDLSEEQIDQYLEEIKNRGRIILICVQEITLKRIMLAAQRKGMTKGKYVFIYPSLFPSSNLDKLWTAGDAEGKKAKQAFQPLLQMASGFVANTKADLFRVEVAEKLAQLPWNNSYLVDKKVNASIFSLYAYDAVYHYCKAVNSILNRNGNYRDGKLLFDISTKLPPSIGRSGTVMLDEDGDRMAEYWIYHLQSNSSIYTHWATINTSAARYSVLLKSKRYWGKDIRYAVPPDRPKCGFFGELCPMDNTNRDVGISMAFIAVLVSCGIGGMAFYLYRKKKFEDEVERMLWKVSFKDIQFIRMKSRSCSSSINNDESVERSNFSVVSISGRPELIGVLDAAYYKGEVVAVRRLRSSTVMMTRADHTELKHMRDLTHENVNSFLGFCIDPPNICFLTKYCTMGSLQDVIENDNVKLDTMFKSSLIGDLIVGMEFLHRSPLKSHGRLKSPNCVIDGRWVLKITDYGLNAFREEKDDEHDSHKGFMWTSPELLRDPILLTKGTQKGDVYSFAIILQELVYRCGPFETTGELLMVPRDIVARVRNGESTPYRPVLPPVINNDAFANNLVVMIKQCWEEEPATRPDFLTIKTRYLAHNKGKRYNIMDNMMRMMEKYANNLEDVVAERTQQLTEEKKKTDILLYRMLPEVVANKLKQGNTVKPEEFDSATVYFSDIVKFTELASGSTPMEVVDFLNDLWTQFDDIIARYNVYKVETIGDAYMVCSGLPVRTVNHPVEISNMALDILSRVSTFVIRHRPQMPLRVRIGLHTGCVASGVIGVTMPRYCLFGDAVNTASRMESTGKPQRIQISSSTQVALASAGGYYMKLRGEISIKGKGIQTTYWLIGRQGMVGPLPHFVEEEEDENLAEFNKCM